MKLLLLIIVMASSFTVFAQDTWESEFPERVNQFIFDEVHYKCEMADYVDGIIAVETLDYPLGKTYVADFSMYGDVAKGYIAVDVTFQGDIYLSELECPRTSGL